MGDSTSGLDTLFPAPLSATLAGEAIEILPMRIADLAAFSRTIRPALPALMSGQFALAVEEHFDAIRAALAIATGRPEAELNDLWPDEFTDLLAVVMQANLDFFVHRLAPALHRLAPVILAMRPGPTAGFSPRPSSPDGVTVPTPSAA